MIKNWWIFATLTLSCTLFSCDIINPAEEIPAYLKVDTVLVVTKTGQGAAVHNISCVKFNVGGTTLGFFEIPTQTPCLSTGPQSVIVYPGMRLNGIASSREVYPFFTPYYGSSKIDLTAGEVISITPTFTYKPAAKFIWLEDFEDAGVTFLYATYSDTTIICQSDVVSSGRRSGAVYLDSEHKSFEAFSSTDFDLPSTNSEALLEFDYRSDVAIEVGIYSLTDGVGTWNTLMVIRPYKTWNRIYIDIHTLLEDSDLDAELFRPGLRAAWDSTGQAKQSFYLDNLKLIHY